MPSDEQLTAFIDGELEAAEHDRIERLIESDAKVAERFDLLLRSDLPFHEAFEPLLAAAPGAKLDAMLAAIPSADAEKNAASGVSRRGFLGAIAACLVVGIAIDRAVIGISHRLAKPDEGSEWRAVVAEYLSLYTPDTLSGPAGDRTEQVAQLNEVGSKVGLALTPEAVAIPGIDFKRAILLNYDSKPLAQIAYLDPESGPMALCITPSTTGASTPDMENRRGMNVVYWSDTAHAFMLIGHLPIDRMKALADDVRSRLTA
ncbi:anti-sigma factor [Agrobacterium sp. SHOUNA12C]|uniref:anti-sigma factor family protein n=1 Tax=Rhizobium rhizogenes TaxID=359 RepID=UPI0004D8981F|nr:transcriptional regulator (anti-sigma factor) [Rhizobium rhizogenes]KAA6483849.1 anti-sigma factor [Agrobacterium sp. ICMP 7243]MCJ9725187.1 anti-sigma factor [Agrobacterium sp. BETTINA12B]MCJ9761054.1 anti-sigma factor [Agrobacterium sp. SHOUNA12C]OCI98293.1 Fis family transcriptional regulator [Agrobacterium sp. 13-626]OCJ22032.1 Fis family transcriptional regulator [Agrobacterium sp. B131/95]OCJ27124.1 Fis family transcriptional regulator [Agrobacterium sp. B133/95]